MPEEMGIRDVKRLVAVRFRREGKPYTFHAGDWEVGKGDPVIVEAENGLALGFIASAVREVDEAGLPPGLKGILRKATEDEMRIHEENRKLETEAFRFCAECIAARRLPMKLIEVHCLFDRNQIIFYFFSENRVDFRELVKDLVQKYRTRIELRQVGARQETRMIRGFGICGREVCCATFLQNFDRVSIKMAKEQNLSLNPEKISGLCGRLMCCLAYEFDTYMELKKSMTKCGKTIETPEGRAKVIRQNVLKGEMVVLREDGKEAVLRVKSSP